MRGRHSHEVLVASAAALVLLAHLALFRPALEDIDSINFALGIRDYDVTRHQPHPPGYPLYILVAGAAAGLISTFHPGLSSPEAAGLVLAAVLAGAVAVVLARRVLLAAGCSARMATTATCLFACAPLPWITGARPLSDMPGLAVGLAGQWLLLRVATPTADAPWWRAAGAGLLVGLAIGVRSQVLWLTLPLAAFVMVRHLRAGLPGRAFGVGSALVVGVLLWMTPMLLLSGGVDDYFDALEDQADEDFEGVPMLATQFGLRRLATSLIETFVQPWATWPLAAAMLIGAAAGAARLAARAPRVLALLAVLWLPYTLFHLLFQETETTRYALPVVLPLCALAATALDVGRSERTRLVTVAAATVLAGALLAVSARAAWQYRTAAEGVFDALGAMQAAAATRPPDLLLMHRRVWAETRRARELSPLPGADTRPVPTTREWLDVLPLLDRAHLEAWWLVDPRRGDRVAIDPRSVTLRERFAWPAPLSALLGGMRPHAFEWFVIADPAWVLHDGWALTPELAGLSRAASRGPGFADGAMARVRTSTQSRTLLVGGRHIGRTHTPVSVHVSLGEAWQAATEVQAGAFHHVWTVPASSLSPDQYAESLTVRAAGDDPEAIALEQFDVQPIGVPVAALAEGWHEPERDVATGRRWRWMADRARIELHGARCDLRVTIAGTWPRHYGDAPTLAVRTTGGQSLGSLPLSRPFSVSLVVPRSEVTAAGRVDLELSVDRAFVAGERTGTADVRRLALEVADLSIAPLRVGDACAPDVDSVTHESVRFPRRITRGQ
jgi:hypothetical protein